MPIRTFEKYTPHIAASAYLDPMALVIGAVTIEDEASLWPMVVARGDVQKIFIGARSNIQDGTVLHVTHDSHYCVGGRGLQIGEEVTVGHQATLHACTIEHHCLIGMGAIVLDGAILEPYTLLAAGSVVSMGKRLTGGFVWRGNPVQQARELTQKEIEFFSYSAQNYVKLAQRHAQELAREALHKS